MALAGASGASTSVAIGDNPTVAGALSGQGFNVVTNFDNVPGQTINVTGAAYDLANASVLPGSIAFGNHHAGDVVAQQALTIGNAVITNAAFQEGLDASVSTTSVGLTTNAGGITNLAAGVTDNTSLLVSLSTAAAGSVSGSVVVRQSFNGTISGLADTPLADQNVGVTGSVTAIITNLAQPVITNAQPISFGNVRTGTAMAARVVNVTNGAPSGAFTEGLIGNAVGTTGSGIVASGGFGAPGNSLAPQQSNPPNPAGSGHIAVNIDTSTAGARSGNAVIDFKSDGTRSASGMVTGLGNSTVAVAGNVYRLANPTLNTASPTLAARVPDAAPNGTISVTNTSPDAYTENLKASLSAVPTGFSAVPPGMATISAGATGTLGVSLATSVSGTFSGTATTDFVSSGAGPTGASDMAVGTGITTLTGRVYQTAAASYAAGIDFGIVHKGDQGVAKTLTVTNTATSALVDVLRGGFGTVSGPFSGTGTLGAGVAGNGGTGLLTLSLNTATAGVFTGGKASLALDSFDADLGAKALVTPDVAVTGTVNNDAEAALGKSTGYGTLSGSGSAYTLDFGTVSLNGSARMADLFVANTAIGPADLLSGSWDIAGVSGFGLSGFNPFSALAAGDMASGFGVTFDPTALGLFDSFITLALTGSNASGCSAALTDTPTIRLELRGDVTGGGNQVPEPAGLGVLASAFAALAAPRRPKGALRIAIRRRV